jgi:hypothetical protein
VDEVDHVDRLRVLAGSDRLDDDVAVGEDAFEVPVGVTDRDGADGFLREPLSRIATVASLFRYSLPLVMMSRAEVMVNFLVLGRRVVPALAGTPARRTSADQAAYRPASGCSAIP